MVNAIRAMLDRRSARLPSGPLRPATHVRVARSEGRTLLLDEARGRYWGLDEVGGSIWTCIEDGCDAAAVVSRVQAAYDASPATLEADTRSFLTELLRARLVEAA